MPHARSDNEFDVAIVGAGAAGLATAIFAARRCPGRRILALDGAKTLGAKILVAGGGRCNVTNARVTPEDFNGGSRNSIRRVLAALPVPQTVAFFDEIGVALHEEQWGKLFPDSESGRTVLAALLHECAKRGVLLRTGARVHSVVVDGAAGPAALPPAAGETGFRLETAAGGFRARCVVLATGGLALPKSGSDGGGYELARRLGHSITTTTPALAPLLLDGDWHAPLAGVSHEAEIVIAAGGQRPQRARGPLLWTHFGISGPAAMDASRHWLQASANGADPTRLHRDGADATPPRASGMNTTPLRADGADATRSCPAGANSPPRGSDAAVRATLSFLPDLTPESVESWLIETAQARPRGTLGGALAERLPARVATALLAAMQMPGETQLAQLARPARRTLASALTQWPLPIRGSRGYTYAEATAGGVPLDEIDSATMASRRCPGLFLVGEILDVDGRIGGFNFQWAWASAKVAAEGLKRILDGVARHAAAPPVNPEF